MKRLTLILISILLVTSAFGQVKEGLNVGGALGVGWGNIGFSGNLEYIFNEIQDLGVIGAGVEIGYASDKEEWNYGGGTYGWKYTYIPIMLFGSFHYKLNNPKLDPYARLGLVYIIVSAKETGTYAGTWYTARSNWVDFAGQVGLRYLIAEKIWLRGAVGTPWIVSFGADIEL